jgi:hypothetical protein
LKPWPILFLLAACAGADTAPGRPDWIDFPSGGCSDDEFCSVGIGNTPAAAKSDARAEIIKWFKSEVKSSARFSESDSGSSARADVLEEAGGIIEGVQIKETFYDSESYYALAAFDKKAGAAALKLKIDALDEKMSALPAGASLRELAGLYDLRAELNRQHHFLSGAGVPDVVKYDRIAAARDAFKGRAYRIEIENKEIAAAVKRALTENGARVSASGEKIAGTLTITEIPINVDGFVKFQFDLHLDSAAGSLSITETETGRSRAQVLESVMPKLKSFVIENIYDLI